MTSLSPLLPAGSLLANCTRAFLSPGKCCLATLLKVSKNLAGLAPPHHTLFLGRLVGVVALATDGEIVGHEALLRQDMGPLGELGVMAVTLAHRGHELHKLMGDRLQEEIARVGQ